MKIKFSIGLKKIRILQVIRRAADIWFDNYFAPNLERTMKLPHKDPDLDELAKENAEGPIMVEHYD